MNAPSGLNPPKQDRSRRTLERIVTASLEILRREGPHGLTVHAIVEQAESSVGSFYARFGGKEDLLDYLGSRVWEEATQRWAETMRSQSWSDADLDDVLAGAVALLARAGRSRSDYLRALGQAGPGNGNDAFARFRRRVVDDVARAVLSTEGLDAEVPERRVRLGLFAVVGLLDMAQDPAWEGPSEEEVRAEALSLLRRYLSSTSEGYAPADTRQVDFFDIWG